MGRVNPIQAPTPFATASGPSWSDDEQARASTSEPLRWGKVARSIRIVGSPSWRTARVPEVEDVDRGGPAAIAWSTVARVSGWGPWATPALAGAA